MFDDMAFQDKAKNGMEVINAQGGKTVSLVSCWWNSLNKSIYIYTGE